MAIPFWLGLLLALLGLAGLLRCIFVARGLRKAEMSAEETRQRLQSLVLLNYGSVAIAALGLAILVVGLILG